MPSYGWTHANLASTKRTISCLSSAGSLRVSAKWCIVIIVCVRSLFERSNAWTAAVMLPRSAAKKMAPSITVSPPYSFSTTVVGATHGTFTSAVSDQ